MPIPTALPATPSPRPARSSWVPAPSSVTASPMPPRAEPAMPALQENQVMHTGSLHSGRTARGLVARIVAAALGILAFGLVVGTAAPSFAQSSIRISDEEGNRTRAVTIGLGKSVVVDLPRD